MLKQHSEELNRKHFQLHKGCLIEEMILQFILQTIQAWGSIFMNF